MRRTTRLSSPSKDAKRETGQADRRLRGYRLRLSSVAWGLTVLLSSLTSYMASAASTDVQASSSLDPDHGIDRIHHLPWHSSMPTPKFSIEVFLILNLTAILLNMLLSIIPEFINSHISWLLTSSNKCGPCAPYKRKETSDPEQTAYLALVEWGFWGKPTLTHLSGRVSWGETGNEPALSPCSLQFITPRLLLYWKYIPNEAEFC